MQSLYYGGPYWQTEFFHNYVLCDVFNQSYSNHFFNLLRQVWWVRNLATVFQNIAVKCIFVVVWSGLTTADLNTTGNDAVEKVRLIIRTITSINK